jgi:hypothetical protein
MLPLHTLQHFKHFNDRLDTSTTADTFITARYAELVENQSCIQNRITTFTVDGMEILISVYSPSEKLLPKA